MRRRATSSAVVLLALTAASCTSSHPRRAGERPPHSSRPSAPATVVADPVELIGAWHVVARGEATGTSLVVGQGELHLFRRCGVLDGVWDADRFGLFVGASIGGDQSCFLGAHPNPNVPWLDAAVRYRVVGAQRLLLDRSSHVVARLEPGAHPTVRRNRIAADATPPRVTPALRAALAPPSPLPASVPAASPADVVGRWQPVGPHAGNPKAFVTFARDGRWSGTDGCNDAGGRYAVGPAGELLRTGGPTTLVGCDNSPVPAWVQQAGRVGVDGGDLVFYDRHARLLGRCVRTVAPPATADG